MNQNQIERALLALPDWYAVSARDLPWRSDREAYHVWISEIMLQQTRVETVKAYYERFLKALPDVHALAACGEDVLLKLWEGLGYYSRARNLQRAARTIEEVYGGVFPDTYEEILSLSGIGPYTAGAISSIAYRLPEAAVDGNVLRVICRLTDDARDITERAVKEEAASRIRQVLRDSPASDPGIINQALMELGAITCVPNGMPRCSLCPWEDDCAARANGTILKRPVKAKAKARRIEEHTILLITDGERLLLRQRKKKGLLAGMNEPVNLDGYYAADRIPALVRQMGFSPLRVIRAPDARHIFTHIEWQMEGYLVRIEEMQDFCGSKEGFFADRRQIEEAYALPAAYRTYMNWLRDAGHLPFV